MVDFLTINPEIAEEQEAKFSGGELSDYFLRYEVTAPAELSGLELPPEPEPDPIPAPEPEPDPVPAQGRVVVIEESSSGRNVSFLDTVTSAVMTLDEFCTAIRAGSYPDYHVRIVDGKEVPASNPNVTPLDNLG